MAKFDINNIKLKSPTPAPAAAQTPAQMDADELKRKMELAAIKTLPMNKIVANPLNRFKTKKDEKFEELCANITKDGFTEQLIVRPGENGKFVLISGHRRFLALKEVEYEDDIQVTVLTETFNKSDELEKIGRANQGKRKDDPFGLALTIKDWKQEPGNETKSFETPFSIPHGGASDRFGTLIKFDYEVLEAGSDDLLQVSPLLKAAKESSIEDVNKVILDILHSGKEKEEIKKDLDAFLKGIGSIGEQTLIPPTAEKPKPKREKGAPVQAHVQLSKAKKTIMAAIKICNKDLEVQKPDKIREELNAIRNLLDEIEEKL